MAQVSYGTITITDTTDIEDVYLIYKGSSSNTTAPSITWSGGTNDWKTDITQVTGDYIWAITVFKRSGIAITSSNYTDYYSDPVCLTGEPGQSISITSIKYSTATTQAQPADNTFTLNSPPTVPEGGWLWSRTLFSSGQSVYSKAKQGEKGDKGDDGVSPTVSKTGDTVTITDAEGNTVTITDGQNGQSYYTYIRYATDSSGSGMSTSPSGKTYIGVYSGTSATAPTSANSYTWSKYVGDNGQPGGTGPQGVSVTQVRELYYLTTGNAPSKPTSSSTIYNYDIVGAWTSVVPEYIVNGKYYISLETTLSNNTKVFSDVVLDQALTDACYNAAMANSISQSANENAQGALSQAAEAQYQAEALDAKLKYFFYPGDSNYPGVYAASGISGTTFNEGSISTYGYNIAIKPASISIGYNNIKAILIDGSNPSLKFYTPSKTTQATNPSMELSSTALTFNNPTTGQAQLTLSANGSLQSGNYNRGSDTKFASAGTKIDLTAGDIITQYFRLSQGGESGGPNAGAYIHGTIEALDGRIGTNSTNYWDIGNYTDYNLSGSAKLIGHGSSFIQLGDNLTWRLATNRIHTGWYASGDSYLHFPEFTDGSETRRWDYGLHVPTSKGDKFLYIRNASASTSSANLIYDLEDTHTTHYWTYKFYVDGEGNIHAKNFYIGESDVPIGGGTGTIAEKIINSDGTYGKGSTTQPIYVDSNGRVQVVGWSSETSLTNSNSKIPTSAAVKSFVEGKGYVTYNTTYSLTQDSSDGHKITLTPSSGTAQTITIPDNNTTYTFTSGTNGFTVTPSGGTAQTVTVTPSITNNVTGSGTSGYLAKWNNTNTLTNGPAIGTGTTKFLREDGTWVVPAGTGVTSVGASGSGGITISGSPITSSGTIAIGLNLSTAINGLGEGTSSATREDYIVAQYAGGGTTTTTYHRRKLSNIFAALNSSDIITALGYTPYNSTNPNGYTTNTGTVTSVGTGVGLTGGSITTSGTIKANLTSDTKLTNAALSVTEDANRIYPVRIDKNSKMVVVVPWTNVNSSYLTEITSSMVTTALGYTPYNSTNPNGYTTNTGTVTKVTAGTGLSIGTTAGGNFTTSGTINHTNSVTAKTAAAQSAKTLTWDDTFTLYEEKYDAQGHITGIASYNMTMPSNPNTHNTAYLYAGASNGNTNASTTNGNTHLILVDGGSVTTRRKISGSGTVSVTSDTNGNITITGSAHPTALPNPNALAINVYSGTSTASTTNYNGGTAGQSVSVASSDAITNVSASAASGGVTTFTLTKANGGTSSFDVTVTASVATKATKLTDDNGQALDVGSASTPVYFYAGVPVALTSATKIDYNLLPTGTSASTVATGNHTHTISLATDTGTSGVVNLSHGGKYKLTAGGQSVIFTLPSDNNTDTKVKLTSQTTSDTYPLIFGPTSISSGTAYEAYYNTGITVNPNTKTITATAFSGNATSATSATTASKLGTADKGSSTKPIYLAAGVATEGSTYAGGTKVTLNGSDKGASTASFYAPTTVGTENYILASSGSGAPKWIAQGDITSGNTDEKLKIAAVTSGTTYYPLVGANSTAAATRQYDATGIAYTGTNGTANGSNGNAVLALGNSTASTSANWKKGTIRLYGTTAYYSDIVSGAPTANRTITLPNTSGTVALVGSTTSSSTTGITISDHSTTSVGSASNWNAGSASTWAFTEVTTVNSVTGAIDSNDNTQLNITVGTTTVQSKSSGANGTKPSLTITSTTVVNGKSHTITDNGHTHTNG